MSSCKKVTKSSCVVKGGCCAKPERGCSRWDTCKKPCKPLFYVTTENVNTLEKLGPFVMKQCDTMRFRTGGSVTIEGSQGSAIIDMETNNIVIGSGPPTLADVPNPDVPALYYDSTTMQLFIWAGTGVTVWEGAGDGLGLTLGPGDLLVGGTLDNEALPPGAEGDVLSIVGGFPAWTATLSLKTLSVDQLNAVTISNVTTESYTVTIFNALSITTGDIYVDDIFADNITANTVTTSDLVTNSFTATNGSFEVLSAGSLMATDLTATNATVGSLTATNGSFEVLSAGSLMATDLTATNATVGSLTATDGSFENLLATTLTVSGGVYLTGIGANAQSQMLYFDSATGSVTYSLAPLDQGITLDANGNILGTNGATYDGGVNNVVLGEQAGAGQILSSLIPNDANVIIGYNTATLGINESTVIIGDSAGANAGARSISIGKNSNAGGDSTVAIGDTVSISSSNTNSVVIGSNSTANSGYSVVIGDSCTSTDIGSVCIGASSTATLNSVSIGNGSSATGSASGAICASAQSTGNSALAFGGASQALEEYAIALGASATINAGASNAIAIGKNALINAGATGGIAIGTGANVSAGITFGVAIGDGASCTESNGLFFNGSLAEVVAGSRLVGYEVSSGQMGPLDIIAGSQSHILYYDSVAKSVTFTLAPTDAKYQFVFDNITYSTAVIPSLSSVTYSAPKTAFTPDVPDNADLTGYASLVAPGSDANTTNLLMSVNNPNGDDVYLVIANVTGGSITLTGSANINVSFPLFY